MLLNLKRQQKLDDSTVNHSTTDGTPPVIRGFIKYHRAGNPLRPIITCLGSPLYNTSKFLPSEHFGNNSKPQWSFCPERTFRQQFKTTMVILSQIRFNSLKKRLMSTFKMKKRWFLLILSLYSLAFLLIKRAFILERNWKMAPLCTPVTSEQM